MKIDIEKITVKNRLRAIESNAVDSLAQSMAQVGLLSPILVDDDHLLIAGAHRLEAARKLGWKTIECQILDLSVLDQELAEIDENLVRNELSALERGEHMLRRKQIYELKHPETKHGASGGHGNCKVKNFENEIISFSKDTSEKVGIGKRTVEQEIQISRNLTPEVKDMIRHTPIANCKTELLALAKTPQEKQKAEASILIAAREIKKERAAESKKKRENMAIEALAECHILNGESFKLFTGDLIEVGSRALKDESIDCIITDPPYPLEFIDCFSKLSELAARVLKPGGSCIVMSGQANLLEVIKRLNENLRYQWMLCYSTPGQSTQIFGRKTRSNWKPVLWMTKGKFEGSPVNDFFTSARNDKNFHKWGQDVAGLRQLVESFTVKNQVVLDPFVGGGSTALAAIAANRKFIGIDIDEKSIAITAKRIKEMGD